MYLESFFNVEDKSFENTILLEIYTLSNGEIRLHKIPTTLNPNSLKNIFVYEGYEFNILKVDENRYKLMIYKPELSLTPKVSTSKTLLPSNDLFKFGCELETCLSLECIDPLTKEIKTLFRELKETGKKSRWRKLMLIYIKEVVLKNADSDFIMTFPKICIATEPKSGLVDYIINTATGEVDEEKVLNFNEYITFTRDSSLVCGDSKDNDAKYKYLPSKYSIHCEIITPTMNSIDELKILYKSVVNPWCLEYNPSTSFHVNVSFIKPVYFSFGFCDELIKNYKEFEERNYRLRNYQDTTIYALKLFNDMIYNIIDDIGSIMYYDDMIPYRNKSKKFLKEGYYRSYIDFNEKYSSLYCKSNRLIEFRLFSSDNDMENIMGYLKDSISLLKDIYENYRNNFNKGFINFQKINLKTGIDFSPLEYYEGLLFYKDTELPKYIKIKSLNNNKLLEVLKRLLNIRGQKIININNNVDKIIFETKKKKIKCKYELYKTSKDIFVINRLKMITED